MRKYLLGLLAAAAGLSAVPAVASAHVRSSYVQPATVKGARVASNHGGYNDRPRYAYSNGTDWLSADLANHDRHAARKFSKTVQTRTGSYGVTCSYTLDVPWWAFDAFDVYSAVTMYWHDGTPGCGW